MAEYDELRARFLKAYGNLPEPEQFQVVAIVEGKPYTWDKAYSEISSKTKLGLKILEKMKLLEIL